MSKPLIRLHNRLDDTKEFSLLANSQDVSTDMILMMCGKRLGGGLFRSVYEFNMNVDNYVVKVEPAANDCNMTEYFIWDQVKDLQGNLAWVKDWFAPVMCISPNGKVLIMERTEPRHGKKRPEKVPEFLSDACYDNFGWIGNKFVCHDYGFIHGLISYSKKFKKVDWEV